MVEALSEDLMTELLSRLPVKSLIRYKSACKLWYDLVQDPTFISKHIENYSDDNSRLFVSFLNVSKDTDDPKVPLYLYFDDTLTDLSHEEISSQAPIDAHNVGPFDGVIVSYFRSDYVLWNLATKEIRRLPRKRPVLPHYMKTEWVNVGFGSDPISKDYKLVVTRALWDERSYYLTEFSHVLIYVLSTNSWRDLKGQEIIRYVLDSQFDATYLNGFFYWKANRDDDSVTILSFHVGNETFQEIENPPKYFEYAAATLGLHENKLSYLVLDEVKNCFEIYSHTENGWNQMLNVGPILGMCRPLGIWKHGSFLMEADGGELLMYDTTTQEIKDTGINTYWFKVNKYKESLISLELEDPFAYVPWYLLGVSQED